MCENDVHGIVGEVLTHIDLDPERDAIRLTTESGRTFLIHHDQDCCESVHIEDTEGNWRELLGKQVIEVTHEETESGDPPPEDAESWTRTALAFKVDDATVISRWIGESNGHYSESVTIAEITAQGARYGESV